jgi:hypothetical protein
MAPPWVVPEMTWQPDVHQLLIVVSIKGAVIGSLFITSLGISHRKAVSSRIGWTLSGPRIEARTMDLIQSAPTIRSITIVSPVFKVTKGLLSSIVVTWHPKGTTTPYLIAAS